MARNEDGFLRLVVLFLLGFSLVLSFVAAVPTTRSLKSIEEAYQSVDDQEFLAHQDATDLSDKSNQLLLDAGEGWYMATDTTNDYPPTAPNPGHDPKVPPAGGRMTTDDTTNDYPGTGPNPAHDPKVPPGAY